MTQIYRGSRDQGGAVWGGRARGLAVVTVDGVLLDPGPSQALHNHSPDGFEWGYGGSGPAQLALALLLHETGDRELAQRHYQDFKAQVVAGLDQDGWAMTGADIRGWLKLALGRGGSQS